MILLLRNCTSSSVQVKLRGLNSNQSSKKVSPAKNDTHEVNIDLFLYPTSTTKDIIRHQYYSLSFSEKDEQAEWVAYKLMPDDFNKKVSRTNDFRMDPYVSTFSSDLKDYKGSGYDRGHLAPAGSMSKNITAMSESFYMSNISPQVPAFNRGIWKRLEGKIRYWTAFNDSIYVVTGPILDQPIDRIGENAVTVPRAFYKTLIRFNKGEVKGIAFLLPNEKSDASIYKYAISIDSLESLTNINFYKELDSAIQSELERNKSMKQFISNN